MFENKRLHDILFAFLYIYIYIITRLELIPRLSWTLDDKMYIYRYVIYVVLLLPTTIPNSEPRVWKTRTMNLFYITYNKIDTTVAIPHIRKYSTYRFNSILTSSQSSHRFLTKLTTFDTAIVKNINYMDF